MAQSRGQPRESSSGRRVRCEMFGRSWVGLVTPARFTAANSAGHPRLDVPSRGGILHRTAMSLRAGGSPSAVSCPKCYIGNKRAGRGKRPGLATSSGASFGGWWVLHGRRPPRDSTRPAGQCSGGDIAREICRGRRESSRISIIASLVDQRAQQLCFLHIRLLSRTKQRQCKTI